MRSRPNLDAVRWESCIREISGFVRPKSDWRTNSSARDANSQYISGRPNAGARARADAQFRKSGLSWNPFIASAVLAAAMVLGASWSLYRTKQVPVVTTAVQTANPSMVAANIEINPDPEPKTLETPRVTHRARVPKVKVISTVIPAAVVPSESLRIEIGHDFTEAHAYVWIDNSLVY
jgi:hypothetical protein